MKHVLVTALVLGAGCSQVQGYQPRGGATLVPAQQVVVAPVAALEVSSEAPVPWRTVLDELLVRAAREGHQAVSDASFTWRGQHEGLWTHCSAGIGLMPRSIVTVVRQAPVCLRNRMPAGRLSNYLRGGSGNQHYFMGRSGGCKAPLLNAQYLPGTVWLPQLNHLQCRRLAAPPAEAGPAVVITGLAHRSAGFR